MTSPTKLSLGPVLFNWPAETWRDFYFRMADEADVDIVYLGETVCSKRTPFFEPHMPDVIERLEAAGKQVVLSSLSLIMTKREAGLIDRLVSDDGYMVEANDISALPKLSGKAHVIGPYINLYNDRALGYFARGGAVRAVLPAELSKASVRTIASNRPTGLEIELQAFGRVPLAISARCYHARCHGLSKDSCQYVCDKDPDGLDVDTMDGDEFLTVNGVQTLSRSYLNLSAELGDIGDSGVDILRLWPHTADMVQVADTFRARLTHTIDIDDADERLSGLLGDVPFMNGFYHGREGNSFLSAEVE